MVTKDYIDAQDMSIRLGISKSIAYRLIRTLNQELIDKRFIVIAGRVPTKYFEMRWYSGQQDLKC